MMLLDLLERPERHFPEYSDKVSEVDVMDESEKTEGESEVSFKSSGIERGVLPKALIKDMV
jgi:hypothetical protein